jgi:glycosyltransferase involved in cell wall biosynthesis
MVVLTESESTKIDLQRYGYKKEKVFVFPVGLEWNPIKEQELLDMKKEDAPTILYFGSIREMKRPDQVLKAFEIAKEKIENLRLFIAGTGKGKYSERLMKAIKESRFKDDIVYFGRVSDEKKIELMQKSHLICVTSVKEGWGLIITEANSQGTPAIAYDVDGVRDACKNGETGIVCKQNPLSLAESIVSILKNKDMYEEFRINAWKDSFRYNYDESYKVFLGIINKFLNN